MKAILEFDMSLPEDRAEHNRAVSATNLYIAIAEFDNYLRNRLKYEEIPEPLYTELSMVRTRLREEMEQQNVSLGDLE